jgi:hypothetical protein
MAHGVSKSVVIALCATAALGVGAASGHPSARATHAVEGCPTHFDYVVLASLADSGNWLGLSTYRSEGRIDWRFSPSMRVQNVVYGEGRAGFDCRLPGEQTREQSG